MPLLLKRVTCMFSRDKHKTILSAFLIGAVLVVAASLIIMLFVFDTERAQKKQIEDFKQSGILKEDETYEFNDTLPQIPDTSWIGDSTSQSDAGTVQAPSTDGTSHKGVADAEMYYDTTRNEPPINVAEEDAIAMSDSVNYESGTYYELPY